MSLYDDLLGISAFGSHEAHMQTRAQQSALSNYAINQAAPGYYEMLRRQADQQAALDAMARMPSDPPQANIGKVTPKPGVIGDRYSGYRWKTLADYKWWERVIIWWQT